MESGRNKEIWIYKRNRHYGENCGGGDEIDYGKIFSSDVVVHKRKTGIFYSMYGQYIESDCKTESNRNCKRWTAFGRT